MPAYIIANVKITDAESYVGYTQLTPATIASYGGKFLVRGGKSEQLEGNQVPGRIVILEFPDYDRAKEWWGSEIYAGAKAIRQKAAYTEMIVVEGISY